MKKALVIMLVIVSGLFLPACNQKQKVPVYNVGDQVNFEGGTILLDSDSAKTNTTIRLCFVLDLELSISFDELFAGYGIAVDRKGIDLRMNNDELSSTNLKSNYFVYIDGKQVLLIDLSDYEFKVGQINIVFEFGSDYINSQNSDVVFTVLNKKIGSDISFKL